MAMDKEMLLQRLQVQYLTRQEVLFKLPLNISINTFWPELIERRKLNSVVLPLHRQDGKPMWYVLTEKMISASEKLCALALEASDSLDPYKAEMTSAMTEELFFTSFVEGAQITLQEAMEFLERGTEPENVQEQMIQNNRSAWADMMRTLYYPLDDRFVRMLAYRLTEDMEGHAADYRQTDSHTIAAMGNEAYEVPPAASIPALMQEYYAFLANTEVHPLIKAAVGQAYLLITRPFPEGNERLSRMISYAVLLRSGYDFFRDISVSGMIARESYRYFKSMQDIIRSEGCGDLTYFIEYYLDLLSRAIDAKAEQERRHQQEALLLERKAATQPLPRRDPPPAPKEPAAEVIELPMAEVFRPEDEEIILEETGEAPEGAIPEREPTESPPLKLCTLEEYHERLNETRRSQFRRVKQSRLDRLLGTLGQLANNGQLSFTRTEWAVLTGVCKSRTTEDVNFMKQHDLIVPEPTGGRNSLVVYHLPIQAEPEELLISPEPEKDEDELHRAIREMQKSAYSRERQMADGLMNMLDSGYQQFTYVDWIGKNPASSKDAGFALLRVAINYGFLSFHEGVYTFVENIEKGPKCYHLPDKQRDMLLQLMEEFSNKKFTIRNALELTGIKYSTLGYYLDNLTQRGILIKENLPPNVNVYEFSSEVHGIFQRNASAQNGSFQQLPAAEKELHDPLSGMAEVG